MLIKSGMPPFATAKYHPDDPTSNNIVTINVGGQIFQTTKHTLSVAGSKSFISNLSNPDNFIPFLDRDADLFSILLSLLRTGNLPSRAKSFDVQDLIFESQFYGIESLLVNSLSNPSQFDAFNLEKSSILPLNGRDSPSAVSTTPSGSLHVAHGSKVTSFDCSLHRKSTTLTQFTAIDSLLALSPTVAAAGATDFSGVQILDLDEGCVKETLNWENVTRSGSTVQAVGSSDEYLFASFESSRRNSSCIMVYDLGDSLRPVTEIGHCEIFGADLDSAIPSTKLHWISSHNLLMASGSHSGPVGVSGNIKFWDIRSGSMVWELEEKYDCFADITASNVLGVMFKVGVNTGEVFFADLRYMDTADSPWICLGNANARKAVVSGRKEGLGCRVESHGNQVFCSKGGNLELWSEVLMEMQENGAGRVFRKNMMGEAKDMGRSQITNLTFGGGKMFIARKDQRRVEVWSSGG